jgi:hypothetical protein
VVQSDAKYAHFDYTIPDILKIFSNSYIHELVKSTFANIESISSIYLLFLEFSVLSTKFDILIHNNPELDDCVCRMDMIEMSYDIALIPRNNNQWKL